MNTYFLKIVKMAKIPKHEEKKKKNSGKQITEIIACKKKSAQNNWKGIKADNDYSREGGQTKKMNYEMD